jgi:hypothetical protein
VREEMRQAAAEQSHGVGDLARRAVGRFKKSST